jgi:periplasmic protein TonB
VKLGAREITIVASLVLHGVLAMAALSVAHDKKLRRATTVALAEQKPKPKPEDKKPEPPKLPPPPPKPRPRPAVAPTPAPAPAPEPTPAPRTTPVVTDTVMSNEVGMDMGTGQRPHDEVRPNGPAPAKPKPAAAPVKAPIKSDHPDHPSTDDAGACTEPPGKPEPTLKTDIEYTEEARAAGIEGRLVLKVTVDAQGSVTDVTVVTSVDPALDAAAIATVKTWRFKPALACGKPVAGGQYTIARRFVLGD